MRNALPLILLAACGGSSPPAPTLPPPTDTTKTDPPPVVDTAAPEVPGKPVTTATLASIGLDPSALDRKADPCEDFYQFACGGWIAKTEIAADKPIAMRSFVDIEDRNAAFLHATFDKLAANPGTDKVAKQVGDYYASCIDEAAIEKAGVAPMAPLRSAIDKVKDAKSLSQTIATLHASSVGVLFGTSSTQDSKNAQSVIVGLSQGGLGLPDRDYYLKDDPAHKTVLTGYQAYVTDMLTQLGRKPDVAKTEAAAIIGLETEIAKVSKDKVALRDPNGTYNKIDKAGVAKAMPTFDWTNYWKVQGLDKVDGVDTNSPQFLQGVDKLLSSTKPDVWRAYLTFHLGNNMASLLPKRFEEARFKFAQSLTGQPQMEPRWKRCIDQADGAIGDLVGQVFVKERFAGESKTAAEGYVAAISEAMQQNLKALPWMDATTKQRADEKRTKMANQIGYPNKWKSYDFKIDRKTWAANSLAARKLARTRDLAKVGKPLDRSDWGFPPQIVNAFYNPGLNSMFFPAGILQPPFYAVGNSIPVNLGAMGMVVGHELTHGFDDQGSQYDAVGNLTNWWQPETEKKFKERTQCVVDQYSQYEVSGVKVNGANTVGENIADIGGIKLAFSAYRNLRSTAKDTVVADGFTEDQQFFLSFAQAWCAKARPEYEKMLANVDVHSPAKWRVNGTASATPEFAKVFRCKTGAKLAPAKQCVVW
jgi:putative endopeptidase